MTDAVKQPLDAVEEFIETFDAPRDPELWSKLVAEELEEANQAMVNLFKEMADLNYVIAGLVLAGGDPRTIPGLSDMHTLHRYVTDDFRGAAMRVLNLVHQSNMSKLGENGEVLRREDGKILKGPNYKPAEPAIRKFIFGESE